MTSYQIISALIGPEHVPVVADAIFCEGSPEVKQKYSDLGKRPKYYRDVESITKEVLATPKGFETYTYAIYYPATKGKLFEDCFRVQNETTNSIRYEQQGWGVIELILYFDDDYRIKETDAVPIRCILGCFSEKQAKADRKYAKHLGSPRTWDWDWVYYHARRIEATIRKLCDAQGETFVG